MKPTRFATLCLALGLASFLNLNSHAQITVDGTKEAAYGTALSVQTLSGWGDNKYLASLSAVQQGASLYVFVAGRPQGEAFILFVDSKPGGPSFIPNNLITGGGEEWCINNFGLSASAGMTFESGFQPDYAIRIFGDGGGGTGAYVAIYPLAVGSSRSDLGDSGSAAGVSGGPITLAKTIWQNVTSASDADKGVEIQLSLAGLGVPNGTGQPVKFMAFLVNGGSDYASKHVLGPLPAGSGDLAGNLKTTDFNTVAGTQTISMTVDNTDSDGDNIPDATDPDDDNDGLTDVQEETLGTNPLLADTDGDGFNDGDEVNGTSSLGRVTSPLKKNYATMTVAGNFQSPETFQAVPYPTNAPVNVMTRVSGEEFAYTLNYNFRTVGNIEAKFAAGSWTQNWGGTTNSTSVAVSGGSNIPLTVAGTGFHTFSFNHDTLVYSFARTVFADFAAYAAAYALTGDESADQDSDGITNGTEFTNNTDPTRANDATPPVITITGNALAAVELNGTYTDAGATATDNVDSSVTVNSSGTVDTAVVGTYTITYSATDAAGNAAVNRTRTVFVYDPAVGFASQYNSIAVPGEFNGWTTDGSAGNALKKMTNFTWHGIKYFTTNNANGGFKFLAGGSWGGKEWAPLPRDGGGNSDLAANVTTNGWYLFAVTELNDTASVSRLEVNSTSDADSDGIPDVLEAYFGSFLAAPLADLDPTADYNNNQKTALQDYQQGINPTQDTIAPSLAWAVDSATPPVPVVAKLTHLAVGSGGGQYLGAGSEVVASSEVPGEVPLVSIVHRLMTGSNPGVFDAVDTSAAGLWQIEYTASDDFGNSSALIRVVVVGDGVPASPSGWFGLNYPAAGTISTMGTLGVYAQIYINHATPGAAQAPNIQCWIGVSSANTDPSTWDNTAWTAAAFNAGQTGNNDEYSATLSGATLGAGTYYYAARWQIGSGAYFYGGIDAGGNGNAWNATTHPSGVLTVNAAVTREVTFAVDMGVQAFRGAFTPGTDSVYVVGDVSDWTTGVVMTREGETSIYKATLNLEGAENATRNYKFRSSIGGFEGDLDPGVPGDTTRVLTLGAANVAQNLATATFNNQTEARKLTLRVDMTTQIAKGNFDALSNSVSVAGSFNWSTTANVAAPAPGVGTNVYSVTVVLDGPQTGNLEYKFFNNKAGAPNSGYESSANRIFATSDLGANLTETTVTAVSLFNNDDGIGPVITLTGASTVNLTVGDTYTELGATTLDAIEGSGTATPSGTVNTAVAGTYTITYNASDAAGNAATPVSRTVIVAAASGSTFTGWAGGATLDATNVGKYAIGGASSPTATDGVKPTSLVSGSNLVLTAIVRTDDSKLTVVAEAVTSLANYGTPASITEINGVDTADQTGVPAGHKRQTFTVAQGADTRKFLRLKATLAP
jgi:hypothetical protein